MQNDSYKWQATMTMPTTIINIYIKQITIKGCGEYHKLSEQLICTLFFNKLSLQVVSTNIKDHFKKGIGNS